MKNERSPKSELVQEVETFLKTNYPVRRIDIEEVLEQLVREPGPSVSDPFLDAVRRNIDITLGFANRGNCNEKPVGKDPDILHVPARLAAITEFEKKNRTIFVPQLPLSRYLGILAIGEVATITEGSHGGWAFNHKDTNPHLTKFVKLVKLQQRLIKKGA
ncbi:MAG TPA: hypothetical protein VJ227_00635 [Patescibacteria group bacterium]|nr:hypothetical protein [Patescibacteria group bacterium]